MRLFTIQNIIRIYVLVISLILVLDSTRYQGSYKQPLLAIGSGGLLGLPWALLGAIVVSSGRKTLMIPYLISLLIYLVLSIL